MAHMESSHESMHRRHSRCHRQADLAGLHGLAHTRQCFPDRMAGSNNPVIRLSGRSEPANPLKLQPFEL